MHTQEPIERLLGEGDPALTLLLAHGRGRTAADTAALAEQLAVAPMRVVLLRADQSTWYPESFLAPLDANLPHLDAALACYERALIRLIEGGTPPERIVVGGFSQGACLTSEWLARHPRRLGGALLFTGGLIGPRGATWPDRPALAGMPVYLGSSEDDAWVPPWRVRETERWLARSGAQPALTMFDTRPHTVSDAEVREARAMLTERVLG